MHHAVGLYCSRGASVTEHLDHDAHLAAGQILFPILSWIALISSLVC